MSLSSVCVVTNALRLKKFKPKYEKEVKNKMNENTKKVTIEGMHCNHCKMAVEKALNSLEGVVETVVDLEKKQAVIELNKDVEDSKIKTAIEEEGFEVKGIN